ncbi:MAG: hypothetical protein WCI73_05445 [Phycisphaerae bacterium]
MRRWWIGGIALIVLALVVAERPARGCLAEYRSLDWQVANSPLIVVGRVVKVTPEMSVAEKEKEEEDGHNPGPSTATLEVLKVIKGTVKGKQIQLASGPIRSCAPWDVHATFAVGDTSIYLCGSNDGTRCGLLWGGCVQSLTMLEMVQGSLQRARAWRTDYLTRIAQDQPATFNAAQELAAKMKSAAEKWPEYYKGPRVHNGPFDTRPTNEDAKLDEKAIAEIGAKVKKADEAVDRATLELTAALTNVPVAVVVTMLALDHPCVEQTWTDKDVWSQVLRKYTDQHADEVRKVHEGEWKRLLAAAGVKEELINSYLKQIQKTNQKIWLAFPMEMPDAWNGGPLDSEALTTDFILRAQGADRGHPFVAYAMQAHDTLAKLDAARLTLVIPPMYGSSESNARAAAAMAIAEIKGTTFTELVADDLLYGQGEQLWRIERSWSADQLRSIVAYAYTQRSGAGYLWDKLRSKEWFAPSLLDEAKNRLNKSAKSQGSSEEAKAIEKYLKAADEEAKRLKEAEKK